MNHKLLWLSLAFIFILNKINAQCNQNYNWTTWQSFTGNSATGIINNNGHNIKVVMSSNYPFYSTPGIYGYSVFNNFNATIPNSTVPETTWSYGAGGTTTMCFDSVVKNPVLLIASLGNPVVPVTLGFSIPYQVLYNGGAMTYSNDTTITGREGNAIPLFPGDFTCVTIYSTTPEYYTNITWGLNPPLFPVDISGSLTNCDSVSLTASGGSSYVWSGGTYPNSATNVFYTDGNYFLTVNDADGCTVTTSRNVKIQHSSLSAISGSICEGQTYLGHNTTGTYTDTLVATNGCDSLRTLRLLVKPISRYIINQAVCEGQSYMGHNTPGVYSDTLVAANGCDSITFLNLTVLVKSNSTIDDSICEGESYSGYNTAGTYIDTLIAANGCDSIRTLHLIVRSKSYTTINQSVCEGQSYSGYNATGIYVDTLIAVNGCDSIRTLHLNVNPTFSLSIDQSICEGQSYLGYHTTGVFTDTLIAGNGCDSLRTLHLTVLSKPVPDLGGDKEICTGDSLDIYPGNFDTYLWQDQSISSHFIVKHAGIYSVLVKNACGSSLSKISISERLCNISFPSAFSPNNDGKNDIFKILNAFGISDYKLNIYNRWGQKIFETKDQSQGWDGTFGGQPQGAAVYVYYCRYKKSNIMVEKKGSVALMR